MDEDHRHVRVKDADPFARATGSGRPLLVVHGGPDFDHTYLLPDLDVLAQDYRLVYCDQRGRGRSRNAIGLDEIDIDLYVKDLDAVRRHAGDGPIPILGHSWGGLLAMHYAVAHPEHVSHLTLLNTAPASFADMQLMREERRKRHAALPGFAALEASDALEAGDPEALPSTTAATSAPPSGGRKMPRGCACNGRGTTSCAGVSSRSASCDGFMRRRQILHQPASSR